MAQRVCFAEVALPSSPSTATEEALNAESCHRIDPHKASNTLVVIDAHEHVVAEQRFVTSGSLPDMKTFARAFPDRTWAVEGARGVGAGLAQRLVAEDEPVLDVPRRCPPESALGGGSGRKTDSVDAHAVAVAGLRAGDLRLVRPDEATEVLRMLTDRASWSARVSRP